MDVLCVGTAAYDLVFAVDEHPAADEKQVANKLVRCGGGPAANAAITISNLGRTAAFAGYLGTDSFGEENLKELQRAGVQTEHVVRGSRPTPISVVLAKPDGSRSLVNFRDSEVLLRPGRIDFAGIHPRVILFDGHEPLISRPLAESAQRQRVPTILDAGSVHQGTVDLVGRCQHLICAEKFALTYTGADRASEALDQLAGLAPFVVITLGDRGLIWQRGATRGKLSAFTVDAVDTTGAGDVFHGAYAAALVGGMEWLEILRYASAAAALCCTRLGARLGIPTRQEVDAFLAGGPWFRDDASAT